MIPLDGTKTPQENAVRYFEKYEKLKRTCEALTELTRETKEEIDYLESVSSSLDIAREESDLVQIKDELREAGLVKKRGPKDKNPKPSASPSTTFPPTDFISMWEKTIFRMKS